jgi:hypothetical protein
VAVKALSSLLPSALPRPNDVVGWDGIIIIACLGLVLVVDDAVSVQRALKHGSLACDAIPLTNYSHNRLAHSILTAHQIVIDS